MTDDVVRDLNEWLAIPQIDSCEPILIETVRRARDEIVALREIAARPSPELHALTKERDELRVQLGAVRGIAGNERKLSEAIIQQARAEALEEAAQRCDRLATDYTIPMSDNNWSAGCRGCAGRVRALKDKGQ